MLNYVDESSATTLGQLEGRNCVVAVKSCGQSENVSRDMLEADSLASLRHPNVVKLFAVSKQPTMMSRICGRRQSSDSSLFCIKDRF